MPTVIDVERVTAVLLLDGWHFIQPKSFSIGPYAFGDDDRAQNGYFFAKVDQLTREMQYFVGPIDCVMSIRYGIPTELDADDEDEEEDEDAEVF
jgi:hypothetical protein